MSNDNLKARVEYRLHGLPDGWADLNPDTDTTLINDLYTALQEAEQNVIGKEACRAAMAEMMQLSQEQNKVAVEAIESLRFVGLNEKHWHKLAEALAKIEAME